MRRRRGFTLFEVLLALSLLLAISSTLFAFLFGLIHRRERLIEFASDGRTGSSLIERLENDVMGAIAGGPGLGAGINGSEIRLTLLTRSVNVPSGSDELDLALGDLLSSRYEFDEASTTVRASRWAVGPGTGGAGGSGGAGEVVSDRVRRIRFRYHDGESWLSSFDSSSRQELPVAIEVAIWFGQSQAARAAEEEPLLMTGEETPLQFGDDFAPDPFLEALMAEELPPERWGEPDRVRLIIVPDGPVAAWKEGE